jgi:hypothetical protein
MTGNTAANEVVDAASFNWSTASLEESFPAMFRGLKMVSMK